MRNTYFYSHTAGVLTTDDVLLTVWPGEDGGVEGGEGDVEGAGGGGGEGGRVVGR